MRRSYGLLVVAALLAAAPVHAAPVQKTVTDTLGIRIVGIGTASITGTGTVTVDATAGTLAVPTTIVSLPVGGTVVVPVTGFTTTVSILVNPGVAELPATFSVGRVASTQPGEICPGGGATPISNACVVGGGLNGANPLTGTVSLNLGGVHIPFDLRLASIGVGGLHVPANSTPSFFFEAAPFTLGTGRVVLTTTTTYTAMFNNMTFVGTNTFTTTVSAMGSGNLTNFAQSTGGKLTLVAPTFVRFGDLTWSLIVSKTFQAVPEVGTLLLLASGVAGVALLGRRRR